MAKLTLITTQKSTGLGGFVEKTVKFRDKDGNEVEGEVLIKIVSHDEVVSAWKVWDVPYEKLTVDQQVKARVYHFVYEDEKTKFLKSLDDIKLLTSEVLFALHKAADEVLDFSGKKWLSNQKTSSSVNSSSAESVEEPSTAPKDD